jgi:phosphoglycerate dehydrogenase-like enzyme
MKTLTIFSDLAADEATLELLRKGVAPHELVLHAEPAATVLSKSAPAPALETADIAFGQPDADGVLRASRLRWLQISTAGYTRYDTPEFRAAAARRSLVVTNSSAVYAEPCAEHALAFMLGQARQLPWALAAGRAGDFTPWPQLRDRSRLLRHQRVLILGFGSIARHLVQLLRPFEMSIAAFRRQARGDEGVPIIGMEELPQALAKADHVVNVLPASPGTERFMSAERFATMKRGAVFYNLGRGATVDQEALLAALNSGALAAAWLDVTEPEPLPPGHPLLRAPSCFITPHIAGGHWKESETLVRHFLDNFGRFLDGSALRDRVM